ncbi:hypothetical protein C8F04DRAFT_909330, partial [Mycena alexandri]
AYRHATTAMSATRQPMLSTTHGVFRWLQSELKRAISELPKSADPALLDGLVAAHLKLSDYFTKFDESRYYSWATLLDPRLSYEGLRKDYADEPDLLEGLEKSKAALKTHFEKNYATNPATPPPALEETMLDSFGFSVRFSHTQRLCMLIYVVAGSAVAVERVFSGGRDTIGIRRASLKAETIEMLMFVKARLRLAREQAQKL